MAPKVSKTTSTNTAVPEFKSLDGYPPLSDSTPPRRKQDGFMEHSSGYAYMRASPLYENLSKEMRGTFVGPAPTQRLIDMLPCSEPRTCKDIEINITDANFKLKRPPGLKKPEDIICAAINNSKILTNIYFENTSDYSLDMLDSFPESEKAERKIDVSGLVRRKDGGGLVPSFGSLILPMEFKPPTVDIVVDPSGKTSEERKKEGFEHQVASAIHARGQLSSYTLHQFQHREPTHGFSVFISGTKARLLRTDHSGVLVSELFDYTKGSTFTEFLWRLDHALDSEGGRAAGVDTTVTQLTDADDSIQEAARQAFAAAQDELPFPVTSDMALRKVSVIDEYGCPPDSEPQRHELIAIASQHHSFSPLGRYTLSYPAYDPESKIVCWVKDAWRLDVEGFAKEGDTYGVLHKLEDMEGLIPEILYAGDVRDRNGQLQVTVTQDCVDEDWAAKSHNVHRYVHYRIVFKTIGRPLTSFKNTKELVQVLSDALKAHTIAYNRGHILHRDISINNVLIKDGRGLLIDWDMCKHLDMNAPRIPWRTGTWQFMSIALLRQPRDKVHALRDDLESFLWLLLYVVLRYRYRLPELGTSVKPKFGKYLKRNFAKLLDVPPSLGEGERLQLPKRSTVAPSTTLPPTHLTWAAHQSYVHRLFDDAKEEGEPIPIGGEQKIYFLIPALGHATDAHVADAIDDAGHRLPPPLAKLLADLRGEFRPLYSTEVPDEEKEEYEDEKFETARFIVYFFNEALKSSGWHEHDDAGKDHFVFEESYRPRNRTRDIIESEGPDEPDALKARSHALPLELEPPFKRRRVDTAGRAASTPTGLA